MTFPDHTASDCLSGVAGRLSMEVICIHSPKLTFSTLIHRVLKVNGFVTHLGLPWLIIQTASKNKLISKNAYWPRQVPTLPYDLFTSAYTIINYRR